MIPCEWYDAPWSKVEPWVRQDAARRFDINDDLHEDELLSDPSSDEGYSDCHDKNRRQFIQQAVDEMWYNRDIRQEEKNQKRKACFEKLEKEEAERKMMRKEEAKKRLLEAAHTMRSASLLLDKRTRMRAALKKWCSLGEEDRKAFSKEHGLMSTQMEKAKHERRVELSGVVTRMKRNDAFHMQIKEMRAYERKTREKEKKKSS